MKVPESILAFITEWEIKQDIEVIQQSFPDFTEEEYFTVIWGVEL